MKKPKITNAPWKVRKQDIIGNEINGYICTWSGNKHDAKAISAVPNMIDALIENIKMMEYLLSEYKRIDDIRPGDYLYLESQIKESKSALKKAGCTDD